MVTRLGILGGTFDPPHVGHLILAELALEALDLTKILFAPAADPPHKEYFSGIEHRAAMVKMAIRDNPHFEFSAVDMTRPGPHYTADTLAILHRENPDAELYFLIGGDSLVNLLSWHDPARVIAQAKLGVMRRPNNDVDLSTLEQQLPGLKQQISFLNAPTIGISATELRDRACAGESIRYQVPAEVEAYIMTNRLYESVDSKRP